MATEKPDPPPAEPAPPEAGDPGKPKVDPEHAGNKPQRAPLTDEQVFAELRRRQIERRRS
jgi:hypothetical protein